MLAVVFWIFVAPAVLATVLSVRSGRKYQDFIEAELVAERDPDETPYTPSVSLIIPVRGADHDLAANLRSFAHQDYPDYELIVACRSAEDDAVRVARMTLGESFKLVLAGPPPDGTGEKVHNLQQAVLQARGDVFAFADSDAQVSERWLHALVQPLAHEQVGAATGFRWYFPENGGFWPLMRSAWDSTIAGTMRPDGKNFAWGGSMALRRATFEKAKVAEYWQGAVSDDYRLTHAIEDAGLEIRYAPAAMAATTGACSRHEFLDWAVRQMKITRVYRTKLWVAGLIAHIVYCGATVACLVATAMGEPVGLGALVVTTLPGMAKGAMRGYCGRLMFPEREDWFDRHGGVYFWYTPLATWIWLYAFLGSAGSKVIHWRGYVYELIDSTRTRILERPPA
ncbi:MAG: glycosyltransferase [Bryobacterales bacterium]|nr:glycosyltransferase [Acidobacteriota bacterium]MCB9383616.1 glycosyltransferase [Bryobacterales bacterium]